MGKEKRIKKTTVIESEKHNWGLKVPGSWDYSVWKIYNDGSYET